METKSSNIVIIFEKKIPGSTRSSKSAREFVEFYQELKESTEDRSKLLDNDKIMKYAKLFEDDVTLDNMDRKQLSAICKSLNLIPIGSSLFLKSQIEGRLRYLKVDDRMIVKEGIDKLSVAELQNANQERGILLHMSYTNKLFRNKRFSLNKMFQRNASKFAIFYV